MNIKFPKPTDLASIAFGSCFLYEEQLYCYPYPTDRSYQKVEANHMEVFNMSTRFIKVLPITTIVQKVDVEVEVKP